jgi:hypothetical protein
LNPEEEEMKGKRVPPDAFTQRQRMLDVARSELDAARTLIANLDAGGIPASVHLVRAAATLASLNESLESDTFEAEIGPDPGSLTDWHPPGVSEALLGQWQTHVPTVEEHSGPVSPPSAESKRRAERSARTVHDILERSARWTDQEVRRRFFPGRWPTRGLWVAAAAIVVAAVVLIVFLPRRQVAPPPGPAPVNLAAREASQVDLSELAERKTQGSPWDAPGNVIISRKSRKLMVTVGTLSHASIAEISLDNNDIYEIDFMAGGSVIAGTVVGPTLDQGGLIVYRIDVPETATENGFDEICVAPKGGDDFWSVGHLILESGSDDGGPSHQARSAAD